jgi:hypothetical protein
MASSVRPSRLAIAAALLPNWTRSRNLSSSSADQSNTFLFLPPEYHRSKQKDCGPDPYYGGCLPLRNVGRFSHSHIIPRGSLGSPRGSQIPKSKCAIARRSARECVIAWAVCSLCSTGTSHCSRPTSQLSLRTILGFGPIPR